MKFVPLKIKNKKKTEKDREGIIVHMRKEKEKLLACSKHGTTSNIY